MFVENYIFACNYLVKIREMSVTVNVVIFAGGKFRENVAKTFHVGEIFGIHLKFP